MSLYSGVGRLGKGGRTMIRCIFLRVSVAHNQGTDRSVESCLRRRLREFVLTAHFFTPQSTNVDSSLPEGAFSFCSSIVSVSRGGKRISRENAE